MVESQPSKLLVAGSIPVSRSRIVERVERLEMTVGFEQAAIKVEKAQEFARLQAAIEQAFSPEQVEKFLKQLDRKGIRIRDFDAILAQKVLERVAEPKQDWTRSSCIESLPVSDQAQMREFYLSKLEDVDVALRHKFKKLYQYY